MPARMPARPWSASPRLVSASRFRESLSASLRLYVLPLTPDTIHFVKLHLQQMR